MVYGDPRFTRDVGLVVELGSDSADLFLDAFAGGAFYLPPEEALLEEIGRTEGGHFNVIHRDTALRADIYLAGEDPFHAWALERRRRIQVDGLAFSRPPTGRQHCGPLPPSADGGAGAVESKPMLSSTPRASPSARPGAPDVVVARD